MEEIFRFLLEALPALFGQKLLVSWKRDFDWLSLSLSEGSGWLSCPPMTSSVAVCNEPIKTWFTKKNKNTENPVAPRLSEVACQQTRTRKRLTGSIDPFPTVLGHHVTLWLPYTPPSIAPTVALAAGVRPRKAPSKCHAAPQPQQ